MNKAQRRQQKIYRVQIKLAWACGQTNSCARAIKRGHFDHARRLASKSLLGAAKAIQAVNKLRELGHLDQDFSVSIKRMAPEPPEPPPSRIIAK